MYSDRSSGQKRSVRDRLASDGIGGGDSRSLSDDAKRFRRDDGTWRRELYKDSGGIQSSSGLASRNLQSNQNSHLQQSIEVVKKSSVTDLQEKLSGVQHPQLNSTVQIPKPVKEIVKSDKSVQKRDPPPTATPPVTMKVSAPAPSAPKQSAPAPSAPKQSQEKADASLDSLLKSLDLEKYLINFQAEEVDMKALVHMNEDDMKSLGIPMGPRKKILSALAHKNRKSSKSLPIS